MKAIIMGLFWFTQGLASLLGIGTLSLFKGTWFFDWDHGDINCRLNCYTNTTSNKQFCLSQDQNYTIPGDEIKFDGKEHCHLDFYFFFLGGLQVVGIGLFLWISWTLNIGGRSRKTKPVSQRVPARQEVSSETERTGENANGTQDMGNGGMSNIQRRVANKESFEESHTP